MKRNAKELCSMLITRGMSSLTEDEEDIVVDYLEDVGIETDIDTKPLDLCRLLLEKTMEDDLGRRVPISAYANSLIVKEEKIAQERQEQRKERFLNQERTEKEQELEGKSKTLPGCIPDDQNIVSKDLYSLIVDQNIGIKVLKDNSMQYSAVISVPENMYRQIFLKISNPVIEITSSKGNKGYVRIESAFQGDNKTIRMSPLMGAILDIDQVGSGFLRLCIHMPIINKMDFTYYGTQAELDEILKQLILKLPEVVNAFSYLSLGLILKTTINNEEVTVRVDGLYDDDGIPLFAGLLPPGESDIPFDINSDN